MVYRRPHKNLVHGDLGGSFVPASSDFWWWRVSLMGCLLVILGMGIAHAYLLTRMRDVRPRLDTIRRLPVSAGDSRKSTKRRYKSKRAAAIKILAKACISSLSILLIGSPRTYVLMRCALKHKAALPYRHGTQPQRPNLFF